MRLKEKIISMVLGLILFFSMTPALAGAAASVDCSSQNLTASEAIQCGECGAAGQNKCSPEPPSTLDSIIKNILQILSIVVGLAAVIMVIIAGLKYITSGGDAEKVKGAKNTLIYALIGLVVVAFAQIIVHFVLTQVSKPGG